MYEEHPVFEPPADSQVIWRYMDLPKLVWLLDREALYFSRADLLGDPHEGALPEANRKAQDEFASAPNFQWAPGIDPDRPSAITVAQTFVSCWNMSDHESASLWQVYGKGVAIQTTYGELRSSLTCPERVYIGKVRYIDYRDDSFPADNAFRPLLHKRLYFENERELRAMIPGQTMAETQDEEGTPRVAWTADPRLGVAASVDLEKLIRGVHVAPGETLLFDAVEALCRRFRPLVAPRQSSLDELPRF
jgi:hypothetical protein